MRYFLKRLLYLGVRVLTVLVIFGILLGSIGQIVRDRTVNLAFLMYIPLLPLGVAAVVLDLWQWGLGLPRLRFGLTAIGLGVVIWASMPLLSLSTLPAMTDPAEYLTMLHWNVRWGWGLNGYNQAGWGSGWGSIRADIAARHPDIVVLSEPPMGGRLNRLATHLGPTWTFQRNDSKPAPTLAILSSFPIQSKYSVDLSNGDGLLVTLTVRDQPLRLLLVDGERNLHNLRTPFLADIVRTVNTYQAQGQPIAIIVGDFNAVSRSLGFDDFAYAAGGYQLAARFARGWQGTWLSVLPLYDIDHVWLHRSLTIGEVELFTNLATDHRGQWVRFKWVPSGG